MKIFFKIMSIIGLFSTLQLAYASEITDIYNTGDTLTATTLNNIKSAVNDNDSKLTELLFGGLDALFSGDGSAGNLTVNGSVSWVTDPPANPFFGDVILNPGSTLTVPAGTTIYCAGTFLNAAGTLIVEPGPSIGSTSSLVIGASPSNRLKAYAHPGDTPAPASMGETNDKTIQSNAVTLFGGRGGLPIPKAVATTAFGNFKFGGGSGGGYTANGGKGGGLVKIYARINVLNNGTIEARGEDATGDGGIGGGGGGIVVLAARGGGVQNTGTIDVSGGDGAGNANYISNGGGGGGGIIIMASPAAPVLGTEVVSGGLGATGTETVDQNTQVAGGGGGGSGGQGGVGGTVQIDGSPSPGLDGAPGYVISLTLDPFALAR